MDNSADEASATEAELQDTNFTPYSVFSRNASWYFSEKTGRYALGPYKSQERAELACSIYRSAVEDEGVQE